MVLMLFSSCPDDDDDSADLISVSMMLTATMLHDGDDHCPLLFHDDDDEHAGHDHDDDDDDDDDAVADADADDDFDDVQQLSDGGDDNSILFNCAYDDDDAVR